MKLEKMNGFTHKRIINTLGHNIARQICIIVGMPIPPNLEFEMLLTNHSRKKIKRRK